DCTGGQNALQGALIGACPWIAPDDVLDCNGGGTPEGGVFTLTASGLVVGQTYWIMFDGSASSQCDYTIEIATGVFEPQLLNELEEITIDPDAVCQGYNSLQLVASP